MELQLGATYHPPPRAMAQDFHAAFGLGDSDRTINMVDANGVLMVAVQALYRRVKQLEAEVDALGTVTSSTSDRDG